MSHKLKIATAITMCILLNMYPSLACINVPDNPAKIGQPIYTENLGPQAYIQKLLTGHFTAAEWEFALAEAKKLRFTESNPINENKIAVALIHLGRTSEALKILEKLEGTAPGSYYIAANLGTAYELSGDNEKAYRWIAESMTRNPESHFGTEWLHLKILKSKQAIKKDPQWIDKNSVLGIDWELIGGDLSKVQVSDDRNVVLAANAVRNAIEYQLHERTEFVKPTDPTVASLLYDLSHMVRYSRSVEHGNLVLNAAYTYGYPDKSTNLPALASPGAKITSSETTTAYWQPTVIIAGILVASLLAGLWLKRSRAIS